MSFHSPTYSSVPGWLRISDRDPALGNLVNEDVFLSSRTGHIWSADETWRMLEILEEGGSHGDADRALHLPRGASYGKHRRMVENGEIEE